MDLRSQRERQRESLGTNEDSEPHFAKTDTFPKTFCQPDSVSDI